MYGALVTAVSEAHFGPAAPRTSTADGAAHGAVADRHHVDHPPQLGADQQRLHHRRLGPVYRAVRNFRAGVDIYNEHLDYVDPHYLYPPGGTLLMAPFGYLPVDASRYWFIAVNTVAIMLPPAYWCGCSVSR